MWAMLSVALEAALLTVVGSLLLARAKAPTQPSIKELLALNVACLLAACVFALFLDTHGQAPVAAYFIAGLEPLLLAAVLATRRNRERT